MFEDNDDLIEIDLLGGNDDLVEIEVVERQAPKTEVDEIEEVDLDLSEYKDNSHPIREEPHKLNVDAPSWITNNHEFVGLSTDQGEMLEIDISEIKLEEKSITGDEFYERYEKNKGRQISDKEDEAEIARIAKEVSSMGQEGMETTFSLSQTSEIFSEIQTGSHLEDIVVLGKIVDIEKPVYPKNILEMVAVMTKNTTGYISDLENEQRRKFLEEQERLRQEQEEQRLLEEARLAEEKRLAYERDLAELERLRQLEEEERLERENALLDTGDDIVILQDSDALKEGNGELIEVQTTDKPKVEMYEELDPIETGTLDFGDEDESDTFALKSIDWASRITDHDKL